MQKYWNGLPFPSPGDLPGLEIEPRSPALHCRQTLYRLSYGGSPTKNTEVVCHSLLQWTMFYQTSPSWPARLEWHHMAWLSFIELDQTVVRVIRLTSFLWLWFQCVCPLMPSRNTYHLTWVSLTLDWLLSSLLMRVLPLGKVVFLRRDALGRLMYVWFSPVDWS